MPALTCRSSAVRHQLDWTRLSRTAIALRRGRDCRIRLIARRGNDWSDRFPLVVEAGDPPLKVRSCLIDGEIVCCDERGLARFDVLAGVATKWMPSSSPSTCLKLDGTDLRREPIEVREATLASILRKSRPRRG